MRRPRAALSRARATADVPADSRQAPPLPDGGSTPVGENGTGGGEPPRTRDWLSIGLTGGILAAIVVVGLYVRIKNNGYGLPYVYNYDEATHFTDKAVGMFGGGLNPSYFQNPSGFTYCVFIVLKLLYGVFGAHLDQGSVSHQFIYDPTPIWEVARTVAASLAMIGVVATFFVGRALWRDSKVALAGAAILTFAFLSVNYSRIAVTDVGTFLPVAIATWGTLRAYETGRLKHYLIAGAGVGFAIGFKYTAGLAVLPLIFIALVRAWRDNETPLLKRRDLLYAVAAAALMGVCFAITTPYFFVKPISALYQLKTQAEQAGGSEKIGQQQVGGLRYYLQSLGWGFGYAACAFALIGAFFEFRRDRIRGIALILFPIALYLYMGQQTRYFGRWLLPIYPIIALLAGVGIVRMAQLVTGRRRVLTAAVVAAVTALVLIQPLLADFRTMEVLGRKDTRQLAREYLVKNYPASLRAVLEPAVPDQYYRIVGRNTRRKQFARAFIRDIRRRANVQANAAGDVTSITYATTLDPGIIDHYREEGFCLVVTMSLIRGRAENGNLPKALEYYKKLERESRVIFAASPFKKGAKPVPLDFDFSYNYYPTAYYRPGPDLKIYQLNNCVQRSGKVPNKPLGMDGLDKGIGSSFVQGNAAGSSTSP
jgi:hypothetical protein